MNRVIGSIKWMFLLSGIIITLLGITLLCTATENLIVLASIIGAAMMLSGIFEIASSLTLAKGHTTGWMLASGVVSILLSIWILAGSGSAVIASLLSIFFAIWVMVSGIIRAVGAISLRNYGFTMWFWIFLLGLIAAVLGFVLLFSLSLSAVVLSYLIGLMLIFFGLDNVVLFFHIRRSV